MPPLQPVASTARVVCNGIYTTSGGPWVNIFHVRRGPIGSSLSQVEVDAIAAGVRAAYVSRFLPVVGSTVTLTNVVATDLTDSFGLVGTASGSNTGAQTNAQPPNVAAGVSWAQSQHFRGGHPRTYLPAVGQSQLAGVGSNLLSIAAATAILTAAQGFRTDVEAIAIAGSPRLVLVRRIANKLELIPPIVNDITGATVDRRVDTQRRRLGKDIA